MTRAGTPCRDCQRPLQLYKSAGGRCPTCESRAYRAARRPPDDGRRELYTVESYGAGWYVRAMGRWWRVPAAPHGWTRRAKAAAPQDGRQVSAATAALWLRWLAVPEPVAPPSCT